MGTITRNFANLITADGTSGIPDGTVTNADLAGSISTDKLAGNINFKNIIINGDMSIAQRGTSVSSHSSDSYTTVDRWKTRVTGQGVWTISQETDVPAGQGFAKSLKWDCTTADASPAATDFLILEQKFEGQNLQYLKYGTSSAESLTVSFWVKSNKTGAYTIGFFCTGNNKHIESSYTINSANTWEKKTVTFVGDTASALSNDNSEEMKLWFWLGAGSNFSSGTHATTWSSYSQANVLVDSQVNLADSTANEWYITGVQLEAGTTASDFEFLPVDISMKRCRRYYQENLLTHPENGSTSSIVPQAFFDVEMRVAPTVDWEYPVNGTNKRVYRQIDAGVWDLTASTVVIATSKAITAFYNNNGAYTNWANAARGITTNFILDAEL